MQIIKSIADGIGTAAGVSWPIYGIIAASLSLSKASLATLILGSITAILFFLIAVTVAVWSFKASRNEDIALHTSFVTQKQNFKINMIKLTSHIIDEIFYQNAYRYKVNQVFINTVKNKIVYQLSNNIKNVSPEKAYMLKYISENSEVNDLIKDIATSTEHGFDIINNKSYFSKFYRHLEESALNMNRSVLYKYFRISIVHFFAAFGSVAGCAAGMLGMFASTGIILGLSYSPFMGWVVLCAAIVFGIIVAITGFYNATLKDKKRNITNHYKLINDEFNNTISINEYKLKTLSELFIQHTFRIFVN